MVRGAVHRRSHPTALRQPSWADGPDPRLKEGAFLPALGVPQAVPVPEGPPVRQLRHHFGPFFAHFSAPTHPTRAVGRVLLGAQAYLVPIGACNPML